MNDDNNRNIFLWALLVMVLVQVLPYIFWVKPARADNLISIDQIGSYNTVAITQDGTAQSATLIMGKDNAADNNYVAITQQGTGAKTSKVEIPSGINNGITINQDGAGNHYAGIQNLSGSANNVTVNQTGAGNHTLAIAGAVGTTNNANTITAEQSGGAGADKTFQLNLNGTNGATVNVQQTNSTQSNSGSMNIQCSSGCGTYNYIRQ
jgi:hypothetical protein